MLNARPSDAEIQIRLVSFLSTDSNRLDVLARLAKSDAQELCTSSLFRGQKRGSEQAVKDTLSLLQTLHIGIVNDSNFVWEHRTIDQPLLTEVCEAHQGRKLNACQPPIPKNTTSQAIELAKIVPSYIEEQVEEAVSTMLSVPQDLESYLIVTAAYKPKQRVLQYVLEHPQVETFVLDVERDTKTNRMDILGIFAKFEQFGLGSLTHYYGYQRSEGQRRANYAVFQWIDRQKVVGVVSSVLAKQKKSTPSLPAVLDYSKVTEAQVNSYKILTPFVFVYEPEDQAGKFVLTTDRLLLEKEKQLFRSLIEVNYEPNSPVCARLVLADRTKVLFKSLSVVSLESVLQAILVML